ncbi:hypothetical protein ADL01_31975 [Streptomyces sp. NRRL WC-3618]|uniref:hypothetical protein n=1 Tax=Streptomyces sp. NRRL WC-3618 TaxID=1519490 RepID=UPI0006AE5A8E|nr:hypothetical protein [Streptomyces sp. NRRL WC-3618]KOV61080.1 hypothetical protein ADL01_31975 [Streptomyces sp. NRRL WC-3618]
MAGAEPGLDALFITLPGPLTNGSKAFAADGNPTFRIGTDGQEAYGHFLDAVANRAASGSSAEAARALTSPQLCDPPPDRCPGAHPAGAAVFIASRSED